VVHLLNGPSLEAKIMAFIHPSAEVEADTRIGEGSKIWHLCHIRTGAQIGEACILGRGVFVDAGVVIGNCVKVQNYVSIFHGVIIEDGVFIGPHVCFTNDLFPRAVNPDLSLKSNDDWTLSPTRVLTGASIGANASILCGVTIGRWAMVGMGSAVVKDVPDYGLVVGNPARLIGYICACGQRYETAELAEACAKCVETIPTDSQRRIDSLIETNS
jgi:UDP-2-acetamido-3-amino-2,3-dideoxy-glucuronate N-acetyltransferase